MNVSAVSNGANVTFVDVTVNGLEIYATYIQNGVLKVGKYVRDYSTSATVLGTNAALV